MHGRLALLARRRRARRRRRRAGRRAARVTPPTSTPPHARSRTSRTRTAATARSGLPGAEATAEYLAARARARPAGRSAAAGPTFPFSFERAAPAARRARARPRLRRRSATAARATSPAAPHDPRRALRRTARYRRRAPRRDRAPAVHALHVPGAPRSRRPQRGRRRRWCSTPAATGVPAAARHARRPRRRIPVAQRAHARRGRALSRRPRRRSASRSTRRIEPRTADNVIAELPGSRPGRVVMAGGHLDSVPEGPGINDNGSGIAALLEARRAARRRAARARRSASGSGPPRSTGSSARATTSRRCPAAERRRIRGYLNFDMVGSPNGVVEVYTSTTPRRARAAPAASAGAEREAGPAAGDSDHDGVPSARGIPIGGIYTGGARAAPRPPVRATACYHRPCDGRRQRRTAR